MHLALRANDGVNGTGRDAERAADAVFFSDFYNSFFRDRCQRAVERQDIVFDRLDVEKALQLGKLLRIGIDEVVCL